MYPTTSVRINDPQHWRDRAQEMRGVADRLKDLGTKAIMLRLASDFDKLAERAAQRAREMAKS